MIEKRLEAGACGIASRTAAGQIQTGHVARGSARGGIVVEQFHCNKMLRTVNITLCSKRAQSVKLRFGIDLRFVNAADIKDRELVTRDKPGQLIIDLPAGRSVRLHCQF